MRRLATASLVGTTLEYYDFAVYNTPAALIFAALFKAYGTTTVISFYLTAALCVTGVVLWIARETSQLPLEE